MRTEAEDNCGRNTKSLQVVRIVLFTILLLFLNFQSDGLPLGKNPYHRQLLLTPFTLLFSIGFYWMLWPSALAKRIPKSWLETFSKWRSILAVTMVLLLGTATLFVVAAHYYALMGYQLHTPATVMVFGGALLLLASNFWSPKEPSARYFFGTVIIAYAAIYLLSIWSFPVNVQRSDMLPLLSRAGRVLLGGQNPYRLYQFPSETVFLTYLPGTVLAFVPTILTHLDLRFANIVYVSILALIIYRTTEIRYRREVVALLGLVLLSPYLQYRHEIYTEPHWLSIVTSMLLLQRGRYKWAAFWFGVSISLSQFSWVLFPFFLLLLLQKWGLSKAVRGCAISFLTATSLIGPFVVWDPHLFAYGVLTHWQNIALNARPINYAYWASRFVGPSHLQTIQFVLLVGIFLYCAATKKCGTLSECLQWMSLALACFIMLNILVWGYFFLLLEVMLLLYIISANGWLKENLPNESFS